MFPLRLVRVIFTSTFTAGNLLGKKARQQISLVKLSAWLDSVSYCPIFDCIVRGSDGLFRLRQGIDTCAIAYWGREEAIREIFTPNEGEIILDVGAHIGRYAIRASRLIDGQGKVIAIEAEPSNFEALVFNLKLNQIDNVIPLNLAAWDKEATLDLHFTALSTAHSLVFPGSKSTKVIARPLDKVLEELGIEKVDWLKIDVEGAEVEVLLGLEKTIRCSPNLKLLVEVHTKETKEQCLTIINKRGYEVQEIQRHLIAFPIEVR
jgi:FkbM family methyltransferase